MRILRRRPVENERLNVAEGPAFRIERFQGEPLVPCPHDVKRAECGRDRVCPGTLPRVPLSTWNLPIQSIAATNPGWGPVQRAYEARKFFEVLEKKGLTRSGPKRRSAPT